ncbi:hypothetical protein PGSY75_1117600 [Plasmodium gaboni]|uniref:Prokaryotic-type class I peptide chain release factors domain-containing protein n=1 Tax=Plasmodium gaboni TaxID=647221 RepID=A0A151LIK5_9APIC|nr:hypothetical protein PGSY75_1117600 [Plasmodium gaboni]KYN98815.1 hypothetical protein PGSY75_1117600 [Plasmodium gaboni]
MFALSRCFLLSFEIPFSQIQKITARSSGPGGQSVNKAETKVQIRFNVDEAKWIPPNVKKNLKKIYKNKLSKNNDLIIESEETSSQISNYKICTDKLKNILEEAEIKKYKDNLINQKKKRQQRKFNKRDYD